MSAGSHEPSSLSNPSNPNAAKPGRASDQTQPASPEWNALKQDLSDVVETAKTQSWGLLDSARSQAVTYADKRKDDAAQLVSDFAQTLRQSTEGMDDKPNIKAFADTAADSLNQFAGALRSRNVSDMVSQAQDVIRRNPATAALASLAAGLVLSRFVKSSARTGAAPSSDASAPRNSL